VVAAGAVRSESVAGQMAAFTKFMGATLAKSLELSERSEFSKLSKVPPMNFNVNTHSM
jgi:hypothetical protein